MGVAEVLKPNICFISGTGHKSFSWKETAEALEGLGYLCHSFDFDFSDSRRSLNYYAHRAKDLIEDDLDRDRPVVLANHSRGVNIGCLVPELIAISGLVFVNGSFRHQALGLKKFPYEAPEKYSPEFLQAITEVGDKRTAINIPNAMRLFYHDTDITKAWGAARKLDTQREPKYGRLPKSLPRNTPMASVISNGDRVINPEHQRYISERFLGGHHVEIDGGHCPMVSRPVELAKAIDELTQQFTLPSAVY